MLDSKNFILKNGTVVDVRSETTKKADVWICDGKIQGIGEFSGDNEVNCEGKFICPGFIDAHVHIESSMVTPNTFAKAIMPWGTTTIIADPHELVNVKGNIAMKYLMDATERIPLDVYVMLPSSIPATPFETNGADFTVEDMKQWIDHERVLGLGEVMCYPNVLARDPVIMDKIKLCKDMIIDGHAPGLSGDDLKSYIEAGVMTDHECTTYEEAKEKCQAGMKILVREGSAARNVAPIISGLVKEPEHAIDYMFCTDDKHLDTIEEEGHICYNIKKSIALGLDAIKAIAMATCHAADFYGIKQTGYVEEGYVADLVVLDSLQDVIISCVYKDGVAVSETMFEDAPVSVDSRLLESVILGKISKEQIQCKVRGKTPVIGMVPHEIITEYLLEEVPEQDGYFIPDAQYSKLCVFERHRGTGHVSVAPLKGYGIKGGAIATSVAHDSHNVIAVGDNDEDILKAVQIIREIQGGYVLVSHGEIKGTLPLQIAGLMSTWPQKKVQSTIDYILTEAWKLGVSKESDPFITLSFMALPVIPELRLTDMGLVDVVNFTQL